MSHGGRTRVESIKGKMMGGRIPVPAKASTKSFFEQERVKRAFEPRGFAPPGKEPLKLASDQGKADLFEAYLETKAKLESTLPRGPEASAALPYAKGQDQEVAKDNLSGTATVQGYFTDKTKTTPFKTYVNASPRDLDRVRAYLERNQPDQLAAFDAARQDKTDCGTVQDWLASVGASMMDVDLMEIHDQFPQTQPIPASWVASTAAHNPGGPPLVLEPPELGSPTSSQEEDTGIPEAALQPSDLVTDISTDQFTYHRTQTQHDITPAIRSELRAGAALTNSYVDNAPAPLVGTNTAGIKAATSAARKRERDRDPERSRGRTYAHAPDTFWTGEPHSAMGWHPVAKDTNTLEGDYHDLSRRTGQPLTGMVLKERSGYTRPTLESLAAHQDRVQVVEDTIETPAASLPALREKVDEAEALAKTKKSRARWEAVEAVVERLEISVTEGEEEPLGELAGFYLEQTFDILPPSSSAVDELLQHIALQLRVL